MVDCNFVNGKECLQPVRDCANCLLGQQVEAISLLSSAILVLSSELMEARAWKECKKAMEEGRP